MEPDLVGPFDELMIYDGRENGVHNLKFNCASRKGTLSTPTIFRESDWTIQVLRTRTDAVIGLVI